MSNVPSQTAGASLGPTEALLAGVLAAAKAALPRRGLDLLVWGASRRGDQATLRYLLANGGGTSCTPSEDDALDGGNTCLWVASAGGHEGAVRELLDSGVDVDEVRTDYGTTALYIAAYEGHEGVVDQLLKAGADVNKAVTYFRATPIYIATGKGHKGVIEQLVKAGADVNKARTDNGATALHFAASEGHEGVIEQLLKAKADVNKAMTDIGATPLHIAASEGHGAVVKQLLKAGADPNAERTNCARRTPLVIAAWYGHSRTCSLLLEAGANVNYDSGEGEVPALTTAVAEGHQEAALVLMEHGASSSDESLTPAMLKDLTKWMAEALKQNKIVVEKKNRLIEQMVQGIPEWCAQAASCVASQVQNDGSCNACSAATSLCLGKCKAPSTAK